MSWPGSARYGSSPPPHPQSPTFSLRAISSHRAEPTYPLQLVNIRDEGSPRTSLISSTDFIQEVSMVIVKWCALIALGPESDLVLAYSPARYTLRTLSPTMFRSIFPSPFFAHLTSQSVGKVSLLFQIHVRCSSALTVSDTFMNLKQLHISLC